MSVSLPVRASAFTIVSSPCTSTSAEMPATDTVPCAVPTDAVPAVVSLTQISHVPAGSATSTASALPFRITVIFSAVSPFALFPIVYPTTFASKPLMKTRLLWISAVSAMRSALCALRNAISPL